MRLVLSWSPNEPSWFDRVDRQAHFDKLFPEGWVALPISDAQTVDAILMKAIMEDAEVIELAPWQWDLNTIQALVKLGQKVNIAIIRAKLGETGEILSYEEITAIKVERRELTA